MWIKKFYYRSVVVTSLAGVLTGLVPFSSQAKLFDVSVDGKTYQVERVGADLSDLKSHNRNYNFRIPEKGKVRLLFVVGDSDLTESQKAKMVFRLKRDKQGKFGAADKDVVNPLKHGQVWEANNYDGAGERFYVKHENGRTVHGYIYVIN